ncbi:MAG: DUF790 family protein [Acidobacteria bacterium]|nr:DUF790 family protein [Acidobacteriota bacterium]
MLTTDLVRVRRRGGRIETPPLRAAEKQRLLGAAERYVAAARAGVGDTRAAFEAACDDVPHHPTDYRLVRGLRKLVEDRCSFEARDDVDPISLRRSVFGRAAAGRRALGDAEPFDADSVIAAAAAELDLQGADVRDALFADLRENHVLTSFDAIGGSALVAAYETAQKQAVLLRAVRVVVTLQRPEPRGLRLFFRRLKFHRLLYVATRLPDGACRIEIDGPFSLFRSVTTYGLQLALLLPILDACGPGWELDADVLWGPQRQPATYRLEGEPAAEPVREEVRLPAEVARLRDRFRQMETPWTVEVAHELLDLPGVGLCVPDLAFTHRDTGHRVYFEVLGYWSREAVWRRVDLVEAGLPQPIVFAVSSRLRVSEEVLDEELPGRLYVYKGAMSARAVKERLDASLAQARR